MAVCRHTTITYFLVSFFHFLLSVPLLGNNNNNNDDNRVFLVSFSRFLLSVFSPLLYSVKNMDNELLKKKKKKDEGLSEREQSHKARHVTDNPDLAVRIPREVNPTRQLHVLYSNPNLRIKKINK